MEFILTDGAHETELKKYVGSGFDGHPLWICRYLLENPEALRKVNQEYVRCGAEILVTDSYQASVEGFQEHAGTTREQALDLIRLSVTIARDAIKREEEAGNSRQVAVLGTVGPYGSYLHDGSEYTGGFYVDSMSMDTLVSWHRPRIEALIEAGVDGFIFATIPSPKEAQALIILLKEHPSMKAIISFSAQNTETISHGEKVSDAAQSCWEAAPGQILAIGVNCLHPRLTEPLLHSIKQRNPDIPLFVRANSLETFNTETHEWKLLDDSKSLREYCRDWLGLGVKYIGGCCRTSTQDIISYREEIEKFVNKQIN